LQESPLGHDLEDRLRRLNEIGAALSLERDLDTLLDRILLEARRFTNADAGTLYLLQGDELTFKIAQNDTLQLFSGGPHRAVSVPPVPLNEESASGYAAVTGETLNIADVYAEDAGQRFEGPRYYDAMTGYHSQSMLVVPMRDHEEQIIGVLQLINAKGRDSDEIIAFPGTDESLVHSLASQAAVSINNVRLIEDTQRLFESFVQVMATAIDERSPYTGGHIRRVAEMTMLVARAVNECQEGPLQSVELSEDELEELELAAWMHDIGKITTPEWVVDKPTKLTTIYDRVDLLRTRYAWFEAMVEADWQRRRADAAIDGQPLGDSEKIKTDALKAEMADDLAFLERANEPGEFMADEDLARLKQVRDRQYLPDLPVPLSDEETLNLLIRKGSLTDTERQKINNHAAMSIRMLEQIPFTRKLARVPQIAGAHHEKLNGSGYPRGLEGEQISLQARILALVDIFESLSADDRPYRARPMPRDLVLKILAEEVDRGHLDRDLHDLFVSQEMYLKLDEIKRVMAAGGSTDES
jgi:HD-GYP domain-containing protein (c-di-GMP phosphodiesterase class II)